MPLRKAIEDLWEVTLAALPGRWSKLLYFARLRRRSPDKYSHWGFEQKYGSEAQKAISDAHQSVYKDVLGTPVSELLTDCESNDVGVPLVEQESNALIPKSAAHPDSHFRYVLSSVKELLLARQKRH
jgi:hypothetical protein